jgi:sulfatase maturation enzyme AslB (radical SAM superfamily)
MKTIRKEMLEGERPNLCERCFLIEDSGLLSPRNTHNYFFDNEIPDLIKETNPETGHNDKFVLKYWDFRWSNICNFKCRMCGAFSSSKWYEDETALYGTKMDNNGLLNYNSDSKEDIFKYVDRFINDVEEIYFAGGEPLIMDEHYIILEKLIAAGRTNVRIRYNTNFNLGIIKYESVIIFRNVGIYWN